MSRATGVSPPPSPNEYLLVTPDQQQDGQGSSTHASPRRGSTNPVNLVSPREYRHGARKNSVVPDSRRGSVVPESRRGSSVSVIGSMPESQKPSCVSIFNSKEVKELLTVGDKVWTADRRVPANVSIRNVETGEIEKELKPPNKTDYETKDKVKEHIFPWSLVHVRFPKSLPPPETVDTSDDEEVQPMQRAMSREGPIRRRVSRTSSQMKRIPSKGPAVPPPKSQGGSSGRKPPPKMVSDRKEPQEYVDEVWVGYSNGSIRCFDSRTGTFIEEMKEQGGVYCMLVWGEYVYSGSNDWTIRKWDASKKVVIGQFLPGETGHSNSVRAIQIADTVLASGSDDFTIRIWDHALVGQDSYSTTGRCLKVLTGHKASVTALAWCEKRLWSGSEDATVMVWDIERGVPLKTLTDTRHVVTKLVALPRIHRVMCCSVDNVVRVYDGRYMRLVSELEGHTGFVHSCAAVATELRYVVWSSSQDGTLRVWTVAGDDRPESTSKFVTDMDDHDDANYMRWKLTDHEAREAALMKELQDLRDKYQRARDEADAYQNQMRDLEYKNRLQTEELNSLNDIQQDLADEHERRTMLQNDLADRDSEITKLKRELARLQDEFDREGGDKAAHLKMINDLRKELEGLRRDLAAAQEEKEDALARLAELQHNFEREKYKLDNESKKRRDNEHSLSQLQQQLEDALDERDRALDEARRLGEAVIDLKNAMMDRDADLSKQLGNAKSLSELEADAREAIRQERDLLNQAVQKQELELLALHEALGRKAIQYSHLENFAQLAAARAAIYESQANGMEAAVALNDSLQSELASLKAKLNARTNDAEKVPGLMSNIQENEQLINSLKRELEATKNKLRNCENELEDLREQLDMNNSIKRKNTLLADELNDHRKGKDKLLSDLTAAKSMLGDMTDQRDRLQDEVDRLRGAEAKGKEANEEVDRLMEEIAGLREKIKGLMDERNTMKGEIARLREELAGQKEELEGLRRVQEELDEVRAERDALRKEKDTWEEQLRQIRSEIDDREARVARSEEVLAGMRLESSELEDKLRRMMERERALAEELNSDRTRNQELEDVLNKMQEESDSEHYNFILQSRTDFIQAVYDWLLCSAMSRRHAKKSDLSTPGAMDALIAAVDGAYKRGHYIVSNYVSELEKHHLGISPSLYPPDPVLQQMFKSQRSECEKFLRGNPAKANLASITRLGVLVEKGDMSSQGSPRLSRRSASKEKYGSRSFTPPAAYRRANSEVSRGNKAATRTFSPPAKAPATLRTRKKAPPISFLSFSEHSSPTRSLSRTLSSPVQPPAPRGGSPLPREVVSASFNRPPSPSSPEPATGTPTTTGPLVFRRQPTLTKKKLFKKAKA
eukprot:TRINITY_DN185_c0_g2_i2.p1 TRINITY_DN185_c0_g2~~TRINITY_DN185_c0_g2_i2.p1  ORF type:complete len:1391 (+),score=522.56 TRINITY_DN185_c0_g2_i2:108-4175(+)